MPIYSYTTQATVIQQIANRLYDPTQTFWTNAELALYLNESLQTWNALTGFWRGDFTFSAQPSTTFYDLTDTAAMPNTLRPYTVTDTQIYSMMQYHFLEPPSGINPWPVTGSLQFTANDFLNAVQRRRDEMLSITGCTQTRSTIPAVAGRIQLADNILDVRRMAYLPNPIPVGAYGLGEYGVGPYGGVILRDPTMMWPEDTWGEMAFNRNYTITPAGIPYAYMMSTQPPISFDTDRPPAWAGSYELLTVNAGAALSVTSASLLSIPDDWTHVLKWGAMADLLSREWDAKDIPRAAYCEQRYRLGLAAMSTTPALIAMRLGNVPLQIDAIRAADLYNTNWEAFLAGPPKNCYHSGLNLLALSPIPDSGSYSFMATVVQNAPLPVLPGDPVQVARDDLNSIIDYAQHLATFKEGGDEFLRTMPLFERFMKQAAVYNGKLSELGEYQSMLKDISQREDDMNPRLTPDGEQAGVS